MKVDRNRVLQIIFCITVACVISIGIILGIAIAGVVNNMNDPEFGTIQMPVSSKVYDIKGRLITELFSTEKREIVSIHDMPPFLIQALLTREDREFYSHNGFNFLRTLRAAAISLTGGHVQGASTITQQLAGLLYADRSEKTIFRKIVELWYAFQLEKKLTKDEILELYLNQMYFGHGCYGVESASKFHFGHSVRDLTSAEAVMLVIQLANWNEYSPRLKPVRARNMQQTILMDMVSLGYIEKEAAIESFNEFWRTFDLTLQGTGAFLQREDKAPYFTAYVQQVIDEQLYGRYNVYEDGLEIYTTLNVDYQAVADRLMKGELERVNKEYKQETAGKTAPSDNLLLPMVDLLSLNFNMPHMHVTKRRHMMDTIEEYADILNPTIDIVSSVFGFSEARNATKSLYRWDLERSKRSEIQGALVCIDPYTGYIYAMVGGREFNSENQVNYAAQGYLQPGSSFKPLYYSAAIEDRRISPATILKDTEVYFDTNSIEPYIPKNYGGEFRGDVPARDAIAYSLNIPSINVLQMTGYDSAISMASRLLDVQDPAEIQRVFPRVLSIALGVVNTSPLKMARAYSAFSNGGYGVTPMGIISVRDRNGKIILDLEKQRQNAGPLPSIMAPQTSFLIRSMLTSVTEYGTLASATVKNIMREVKLPYAGKTGTTQNWRDSWVNAFTPYYTTSIWCGFDRGGGTLGISRTGAQLLAPIWASFNADIHKMLDEEKQEQNRILNTLVANGITDRSTILTRIAEERNLPIAWVTHVQETRNFNNPGGIEEVEVCKISGLLPSSYCPAEHRKMEYFYPEMVPTKTCTIHQEDFHKDWTHRENISTTAETETGSYTLPSDLTNPNELGETYEEYLRRKGSGVQRVTPDATTKPREDDINRFLID